jgi:probable F420-dependent oxidoreductase
MKFSVSLQTSRPDPGPEFVSAEGITAMAQAAERAGFDAVATTDHPVPEDIWMRTGGHHALDPFVELAYAAAVTTRLRLLTHIYVLPLRNPFLTAKGAASLDVLSNGRLIFGIAAGYLEPEFRAAGVDYAERNELTDEAIRAMKVAWSEEGFSFEGRHFTARGHTALPFPAQKPHPPLWVGGNSRQAIRRAVTLCDGWMPIYSQPEHFQRRKTPPIVTIADLAARIRYAKELAQEVGRTAPLEITFSVRAEHLGTPNFSRDKVLEEIGQLREAGVTYLHAGLPGATRAAQVEQMAQFGEEILARL